MFVSITTLGFEPNSEQDDHSTPNVGSLLIINWGGLFQMRVLFGREDESIV